MSSPFDSAGDWLRRALHAHTTKPDGAPPPEMLVQHCVWTGFDVLEITDRDAEGGRARTNPLWIG